MSISHHAIEQNATSRCTKTCLKGTESNQPSFLSKISQKIYSLFSRSVEPKNYSRETSQPLVASFAVSQNLAQLISRSQNPTAKDKLQAGDLDFNTNSRYDVFSEIIERYVPARKDGLPIDPKKIITIKNEGSSSCVIQF